MDLRVARVIALMEETIDGPGSLAELAADVSVSPAQLTRLFRQHTGMTPADYLHWLRLGRARALLERTFLSVGQVMSCVGLDDPASFSRDFVRQHGFAPSHIQRITWTAGSAPPTPLSTDCIEIASGTPPQPQAGSAVLDEGRRAPISDRRRVPRGGRRTGDAGRPL
jgi:AraC-like DNA-binding protein